MNGRILSVQRIVAVGKESAFGTPSAGATGNGTGDDNWFEEFKAKVTKIAPDANWNLDDGQPLSWHHFIMVPTEELNNAQVPKWYKGQLRGQDVSYRPHGVVHHDAAMIGWSIGIDYGNSGSPADQIATDAMLLSKALWPQPGDPDSDTFPHDRSKRWIGEAVVISIETAGQVAKDEAVAAATKVADVLNNLGILQANEKIELVGPAPGLQCGFLFRWPLLSAGRFKALFQIYVAIIPAAAGGAFATFDNRWLHQILLPEMKALFILRWYQRAHVAIENAARRLELEEIRLVRKLDAVIAPSATGNADVSQLRQCAGNALASVSRWRPKFAVLCKHARTMEQNAQTNRSIAQELISQGYVDAAQAEQFAEWLSRDSLRVSNQLADDVSTYGVVDKATGATMEDVHATASVLAANESGQLMTKARWAFGVVAIAMAAFGLPDWFGGADGWESIPYWLRFAALVVVLFIAGFFSIMGGLFESKA